LGGWIIYHPSLPASPLFHVIIALEIAATFSGPASFQEAVWNDLDEFCRQLLELLKAPRRQVCLPNRFAVSNAIVQST
jgi:hypothetical protein